MDLGLGGKAALVAGASRGIGRAITLALAREGARVAAVARTEPDLASLMRELGPGHVSIAADVITAGGARAAVEGAVQAFSGLDIVVSVVGACVLIGLSRLVGPRRAG